MSWKRLALVGLFALYANTALAADWAMVAEGSRLEFTATYLGTPVPGVFRRFDTRFAFDPQQPSGGRLEVTVFTGSAEMTSSDITEAVRGPDWFDTNRFPQARFVSTEVAQQGPVRYLVHGVLTLKGIQQKVDVPFSWSSVGDAATMQGQLTLKRTDFNVGTGEWAGGETIGLDVPLKFNVKLRRSP